MKKYSQIIRLVVILIVGVLLTYLTYQSKYSTFLFDLIIFGIVAIIGLTVLFWSLLVDLKKFKTQKKAINLIPPILGIVFISIILTLNWKINSTFNKPTLIRIYYDGDFNGTGIDFKTDGTYIFDNSAIGLSDYEYGTYQLKRNSITLDKSEIDNVIKTNRLEIQPKEIKYSAGVKSKNYAFQINKIGARLENEIEFKVIIDNREK